MLESCPSARECGMSVDVDCQRVTLGGRFGLPFGKLNKAVMTIQAIHLLIELISTRLINMRNGSAQIWPIKAVNVSSPKTSAAYVKPSIVTT